MTYRPGIIIGTRPEAIKMAPLVAAFRETEGIKPIVIVTGQHNELLHPVLSFFGIFPEVELGVMVRGQSLAELNSRLLFELDRVIPTLNLNSILVQGDTTSALAGAMVGFYRKIDVVHIEAGLRTDDLYAPFPEEFNRRVIDQVAMVKFPPTEASLTRLVAENLGANAVMVGNTVIDALLLGLQLIDQRGVQPYHEWMASLGCVPGARRILVTTHRRENGGAPLDQICWALRQLLDENPELEILLPVHRNPEFFDTIHRRLKDTRRMILLEPLPYDKLIWAMSQSTLVLTDSGGLQEEAPALNKPVLVMRDVTERPEGVTSGCAVLVGTSQAKIVNEVTRLLRDPEAYSAMAGSPNPYGDGTASRQIVNYLKSHFTQEVTPGNVNFNPTQ